MARKSVRNNTKSVRKYMNQTHYKSITNNSQNIPYCEMSTKRGSHLTLNMQNVTCKLCIDKLKKVGELD